MSTDQVSEFAVNGSALPDLDFDIGESYAGLLPIGSSNDTDLFFWFFPSTNEAAKEEIVVWFTGGVRTQAIGLNCLTY